MFYRLSIDHTIIVIASHLLASAINHKQIEIVITKHTNKIAVSSPYYRTIPEKNLKSGKKTLTLKSEKNTLHLALQD